MKISLKLLLLAATAVVFLGCSGSEPAPTEPVKTDSSAVRSGASGPATVEAKE